MRLPVISRFVATSAAALTLGVALPLLAGGTAFACGDEQPPAAVESPEPRHATDPVSAFVPEFPTSLTAGGQVEIGVEIGNFTGAAYQRLAPTFAVFASTPGPGHTLVNLQIPEVNVDVMVDGSWRHLPMHHSCDPTLVADTSSLRAPLADGHARRYMFRLGLTTATAKAIKKVDVLAGTTAGDVPKHRTLAVNHPAPAPAPATTPPVAKAAPAVPAAVITTPTAAASATPSPKTAAAATLAQTGPAAQTGWLFGSGAACLAAGAAVLYAVRRRYAR
ncbi:LPXTG cell wall anchor domain-containing protein [Kitasatospora sp. McL0602]|uniref:LPXTG cell wall anchor domain-containing protein n=1 Tax=Kitasatospora sp. McL0602 TaxID=3439530 RepID=UPI003F89B79C